MISHIDEEVALPLQVAHGSFCFRPYRTKTPDSGLVGKDGEEKREGGEGEEEEWSAPIFLTNNLHLREPTYSLVTCGYAFYILDRVLYIHIFSFLFLSPPQSPSTFSLFSATKTPDPYSLSFQLFPSLSLQNSLCSPLAFSLSQSEKEKEKNVELASGFLLQVIS